MLPLDLRTTLAFTSLLNTVFAVAIILLWRRDRHRYLPAWSGGYAALALALILIAGRDRIPDFLSIVVADAAVLLGSILLYLGTAMFYRRRPALPAAWGLFAVSIAGVLWFSYVRPDINMRTLIITAAQLAITAVHLAQFFGPRRHVRWSESALAIFFICIYAIMLLGRFLWTLTDPVTASLLVPTTGQNAVVLLQALSGVGVGLGLCNLHAAALIDTARESEQRLAEANDELTKLTVRLELRNTEYAQARDFAETANRSKSQFLANMSHELRTPLNAIIGFSEMIRDGMLGPIGTPVYRDYAADINRSGMHLLQLVTDILDVSRAEAGHLSLNEEICDPARVVEGSVVMIREAAHQGQVALEVAPMDRTPWLFADERRLRQILINLLSNAVKFTLPGGRVAVSLALESDGGLAFSVEDTGIGMSQAHIEIALTPFGQVDSQLNRQYEGAGLGLPLTRQLVDLHDGELEVTSRLGEGTRVVARFPAYRIRPRLV
jgi:signal transduction histidine kinase